MNNRGIIWLLINFSILICTAWGMGDINGFIRNADNSEPLSYANVYLKGTNLGAVTNQEGYYVIIDVPTGEYELSCSLIGYESKTCQVSLINSDQIRIDIKLKSTVLEGEQVTVTAERIRFKEAMESSRITLSLRDIDEVPAFMEADVFRTIQLLPGVQTLNDFSSALYVRGSTPDQNLIMLDGITVYNPYHLGGIFSTFNTDAIKEADFRAGGFPARYGGRMGSILNIINREGNAREFEGKVNISMISSKAILEGPVPDIAGLKGSWMLAGRRTYIDKVVDLGMAISKPVLEKKTDYDSEYYPEHMVPYHFYDLEGKINLNLGANHRLTFSSFYGDDVLDFKMKESWDDLDFISNSNYRFLWLWGNKTNSLTWRWIISPQIITKTFIAHSRFRFRIEMDETDEGCWADEGSTSCWNDKYWFDVYDIIDDRTLESEITWLPNSSHVLTTGFSTKNLDIKLGMVFGTTELTNPDSNLYSTYTDTALWMNDISTEQAIFLQDKWKITKSLSAILGMRFTNFSLHDDIYFDPRLGFKFMPRDNLALKLTWGRYHQFISIANSADENLRFIDIWLVFPEDRSAPSSDHLILGAELFTDDNLLVRTEVYYKSFENLITLKQGQMFAGSEDNISFDTFNEFYDTDAESYGLEILLKKSQGKVLGWLGYTYARTRWKTDLHGWYAPKFDRTHTINLVADWQWTDITHIGTTISFSSGNPYTPILGQTEQWVDDYNYHWGNESFLVGEKNSERYPAYFRWDVSFTRRKELKRCTREFYIQIINVTNHLNTLLYIYDQDYSAESDESGGVRRFGIPMFPILPTIGVRFEF